jgi:transaldolase
MAAHGAQPQRLLWASTSTKDPAYADVMYVEALIGRDTVNTMPSETLAAYRDHGRPLPRLEEQLDEAVKVPARLVSLGIELGGLEETLEAEGLRKFVEPYDRMQQRVAQRATALAA